MKPRIVRHRKPAKRGPSPWMTRREVKDYLRVSWDTVDRRCIRMADGYQDGKFRYMEMRGGLERIRILAEDVYKILPLPESSIAA